MSEVLFASFAASWFITRLGIYPTWIIYSATVEAPQLIQYFPGYFVFNALLSALLLLNIVWAYLICKVVYNSLMANETIANDIRSDTSEDGKDATTGNEVYFLGHILSLCKKMDRSKLNGSKSIHFF